MLGEARQQQIVLASASPRRHQILDLAGIPHYVLPSQVDEHIAPRDSVSAYIEDLALLKARSVFGRTSADPQLSGRTVLAADTIVVLDGRMLGKPADARHAARMLRALSGRTHQVITGVALISTAGVHTFSEVTDVTFDQLAETDIEDYISSGEPFDKAGAYGIQGRGGAFVTAIRGDYYNVVGLPLNRVLHELAALNADGGFDEH